MFGKKNFDLHRKTWCGDATKKRINGNQTKVYNIIPEKLLELQTKYPKEDHDEDDEELKQNVTIATGINDQHEQNYL